MYLKGIVVSLLALVCNIQSKAQSDVLYKTGIADSLYSEVFGEQKNIWVELPEQYNPESKEKYPVVFVLDGSVQMRALSSVYNYYWGHYLPNMILVGISNQTNRTRDLTPTEVNLPYIKESGGAENFTKFIEKELIPYIDKHYPTTTYRTLIGHSYAGLFTVNTLINHPLLFSNYIAIDPSLDWDKQNLIKTGKSKLLSNTYKNKSLFIAMAGEQLHMQDNTITIENVKQDTSEYTMFARSILELSDYLEGKSGKALAFSKAYYPNDLHGTVPLPAIKDGLLSVFNWYKMENPSKFNNPETLVADLLSIINYRAEKLTSHFGYNTPPMDEEQMNMMGYMALQFGQAEKAKAFFDMNIKFYPKSANSYDSMADYYEAQADLKQALVYVKKAYEISGDPYHKTRLEGLKEKLK